MQKGDMVDIKVPGSRNLASNFGRVEEFVPPNCHKVYVIPLKGYYLIQTQYLTLRAERRPVVATQEDIPF